MSSIEKIIGRQVWDSRGRPTVEVEILLQSGARGRSIAPSGASTGKREALDRRDGGARLGGFGVNAALHAVNGEIAGRLRGLDALDQSLVDGAMIALDGTEQKSRLGGNSIIATSQAVAWAAAAEAGIPLWRHLRRLAALDETIRHVPQPMIQIFGGGRHAGNRIDIQDFLVVMPGASSFAEAVEWSAEVYLSARMQMEKIGRLNGVADEGGVWPDFSSNEEGLERLTRAIEDAGFEPKTEVAIALDVAATSFFENGRYRMALDGRVLDTSEMVDLIVRWCDQYPVASVEDPLAEDDDAGFAEVTRRIGDRIRIVGDDLLTTNAARIRNAGQGGVCNAVLLKANQCGTVSELIAAARATADEGLFAIQSGRSGESEDVTLSHLAVGLVSQQIKVGSVARSERTAKWNEVLRIENEFRQ